MYQVMAPKNCPSCQLDARARLRYGPFLDVSVYGGCYVTITNDQLALLGHGLREHEIWWHYVACAYVFGNVVQQSVTGFNMMKTLFPNRSVNPVSSVEDFTRVQTNNLPTFPRNDSGIHVHFFTLTAREVTQHTTAIRRKQTQKVVTSFYAKACEHLQAVDNAGIGVACYSSNRKQDDARRAILRKPRGILREPVTGAISVKDGGRMKHQSIAYGKPVPHARPTGAVPSPDLHIDTILVPGPAGSTQFDSGDCNAKQIVGFVKKIHEEFDAMFEYSIVKSLVTARVMQPQEYLAAELWLEIYSDGVTPSSENVSVHMAKVIDPFRLVWKNGYSPSFRRAGAEGKILSLDPWIVRALSLFVSRGHMVHPSLVMFFVIKFLGGDNKSLGLCMGRSQNGCPSLQPGAVERFMPASVLDKAVSYLRALFEVAAWIVTRPPSFRIHHSGRVNALFDRLKSQRGVIRFSLFVEGNALADCQMLNVLEDWLSLSGTPLVVGAVCDGPSSAVLDLYCDLRELDVLLGACAPRVSGRVFLPSVTSTNFADHTVATRPDRTFATRRWRRLRHPHASPCVDTPSCRCSC